MKKVLRFWIWLFLFSLFPVTTSAQVQRYVSKQKALSIVQEKFRGQDSTEHVLSHVLLPKVRKMSPLTLPVFPVECMLFLIL